MDEDCDCGEDICCCLYPNPKEDEGDWDEYEPPME